MKRSCPSEGTCSYSYFLSLKIVLALLSLIVSPLFAVAQNGQAPPKRLTIGVALEGGGALGLAHIGVLRWFEQHHIPIDYLSGNSMGALVGGMYATGKTPDELEVLVKHIDWPLVIGGATPYQDLSFRRKEDAAAIQDDLVIGFKHGATLPSGLSSGHQISLIIDHESKTRRILGHYDPAHNAIVISRIFDQISVPRYAVEYIVYHEMLHLKHPVRLRGSRRCVHSAEFQAEEKLFPRLDEAEAFLKRL